MGAGAEGHAGVQRDDGAGGFVLFPARHDGKAPAYFHSVVILLPAVLPILLLHALTAQSVGHFGTRQPVLHQLCYFGKVFVRCNIKMHRHLVAAFFQKRLLNQIHMRDGLHLLL